MTAASMAALGYSRRDGHVARRPSDFVARLLDGSLRAVRRALGGNDEFDSLDQMHWYGSYATTPSPAKECASRRTCSSGRTSSMPSGRRTLRLSSSLLRRFRRMSQRAWRRGDVRPGSRRTIRRLRDDSTQNARETWTLQPMAAREVASGVRRPGDGRRTNSHCIQSVLFARKRTAHSHSTRIRPSDERREAGEEVETTTQPSATLLQLGWVIRQPWALDARPSSHDCIRMTVDRNEQNRWPKVGGGSRPNLGGLLDHWT